MKTNRTLPAQQRAKIENEMRASLKKIGISDPFEVTYILNQVVFHASMSYIDGQLFQIDRDMQLAKTIQKGRKQ